MPLWSTSKIWLQRCLYTCMHRHASRLLYNLYLHPYKTINNKDEIRKFCSTCPFSHTHKHCSTQTFFQANGPTVTHRESITVQSGVHRVKHIQVISASSADSVYEYVYTHHAVCQTIVYTPHPASSSHSWHSQTFTGAVLMRGGCGEGCV